MSKTVLIVSYYWPPAGGPGVQRTLKFAKYLPDFGYQPIILTVENNQQLGVDESLLVDVAESIKVYKTKVAFQTNNKSGKSFTEKKGLVSYVKKWVRGNILIPDAKIFWLFQSKNELRKIFDENKIDIVFVSGPPQTSHLIGHSIKKKYKIPVVHDFRDPWTDAFFLKEFPRTLLAKKIDSILEKKVLKNADAVIAVSEDFMRVLEDKAVLKRKKIITNGYDSTINQGRKKEIKEFVYTGTLSETAIPYDFLLALRKKDIKLRIIGQVHVKLKEFIKLNNLLKYVRIESPVEYNKIIDIQKNADAFLITIPNLLEIEGMIPGKLFEYFAANRPIFAVASAQSDLVKKIEKSSMGLSVEHGTDCIEKLTQFLNTNWKSDLEFIESFHRKNLTSVLAMFFDDLLYE